MKLTNKSTRTDKWGGNITGYKINIQTAIAFLFTSNELKK